MTAPGAVEAAFRAVPRTSFLPRAQVPFAGRDAPLDIGGGQTSSQPSTVATMLDLLDVEPGHAVLDVGAGSGWTTALLAHLVGPSGRVLGVELDRRLAAWGAENLERHGAGDHARLVRAQPGVLGCPDEAPFDRILVSAMARRLPEPLVEQLRTGGVMVAPVAGKLWRVELRADGERHITRHGSYRFVPLR